ncbi:MAG: ABC transporter ATP-binding protein [Acidobacteriota bacterium]|nr:ABC transporter ATP-binding protein [Acidobacteriota bacterium]MDQ3419238.1 ABC transporter ATP-binding protein [Acidobacteriota bacterium]
MAWWNRNNDEQTAAGSAGDSLPADGPVIRLQGVTRIFKDDADEASVALDNVTVDVGRGDYVCISGPSGCGKSTLLSILALLETPTSGRYWLNGRAVDRMTPAERARARSLDVGLIFQSFNLIGDMTVYENVEYPLTLRGASPADRRRTVETALERVGMMARAKQRPGSLSGGHQQLVAVARAIAGRPALLLADEPTGNLDSKSGEALMQMLSELHADGATVCIATHDPRWIAQAPKHLRLFDGRVVEDSGSQSVTG